MSRQPPRDRFRLLSRVVMARAEEELAQRRYAENDRSHLALMNLPGDRLRRESPRLERGVYKTNLVNAFGQIDDTEAALGVGEDLLIRTHDTHPDTWEW